MAGVYDQYRAMLRWMSVAYQMLVSNWLRSYIIVAQSQDI